MKKVLDFLPTIAMNIAPQFKTTLCVLLSYESYYEITRDTYLVLYAKDDKNDYQFTTDIRLVLEYVAEYGKNCQVIQLLPNSERIIDLLY